jgi:hypothetical protein
LISMPVRLFSGARSSGISPSTSFIATTCTE